MILRTLSSLIFTLRLDERHRYLLCRLFTHPLSRLPFCILPATPPIPTFVWLCSSLCISLFFTCAHLTRVSVTCLIYIISLPPRSRTQGLLVASGRPRRAAPRTTPVTAACRNLRCSACEPLLAAAPPTGGCFSSCLLTGGHPATGLRVFPSAALAPMRASATPWHWTSFISFALQCCLTRQGVAIVYVTTIHFVTVIGRRICRCLEYGTSESIARSAFANCYAIQKNSYIASGGPPVLCGFFHRAPPFSISTCSPVCAS